MKKIINWFKDMFYNATDYAIILFVVVAVAAVLIWRFDILFNLKIEKDILEPNPINISDNKDKDKSDTSEDKSDDDKDDSSNNEGNQGTDTNNPAAPEGNGDSEDDKKPEQGNTNPTNDGAEISINIPEGTFPGKIADILIEKALIDDKQAFIIRCTELKLDTKLKSGDFKIKKGTSLDDIIKIIAKVN